MAMDRDMPYESESEDYTTSAGLRLCPRRTWPAQGKMQVAHSHGAEFALHSNPLPPTRRQGCPATALVHPCLVASADSVVSADDAGEGNAAQPPEFYDAEADDRDDAWVQKMRR